MVTVEKTVTISGEQMAALALIKERFEDVDFPYCLYYHNTAHTSGVVERALKIANAMRLSQEEQNLVVIAAAFHDVVQEWSSVSHSNGAVMRESFSGYNEIQSCYEAACAMRESNHKFESDDYAVVSEAIMTTVPTFNPIIATAWQRSLESHTHPVARAVALADLGEAGMDAEAFGKGGLTLFAEENLDIMQLLLQPGGIETLTPLVKEQYKKRILGWLQGQVRFALGRQLMLAKELVGLPPAQTRSVSELFSQFEISIETAIEKHSLAADLGFDNLASWLLKAIEK